MSPRNGDPFLAQKQIVEYVLCGNGFLFVLVSHEGVSSRLPSQRSRAMKKQIELLDGTVFLQEFQKVIPVKENGGCVS